MVENSPGQELNKRDGSVEITSGREINPGGNGGIDIKQQMENDDRHMVKREGESPRGLLKREAQMSGDEFTGRYKVQRLNNGRLEVDLTDE